MASTPSPLGGSVLPSSLPSSPSASSANHPNEKTRRYDRQLRLWGDHGQHALERARVCLAGGANATGCETLKSLVLPGVGAFTIADAKDVTKEDIGNSFFLEMDSLGRKRGAVATQLLLEMNNEVRGDFVDQTVEEILKERPEFFKTFTLVVVTEVAEKTLNALSTLLWEANIPLVVVRSYGFIGCIRLQVKEHTIMESHPESKFEDLRLDYPLPGFLQYCQTQDMSQMTKQQHNHTPYLVILHQRLEEWKKLHDGKTPKTYPEKAAFKEFILDARLRNEEGVPEDEENFEEAVAAVNTALSPTHVPAEVKEILDDDACLNLGPTSSDFWVICWAVRDFIENEGGGNLPVSGVIPDMFSDSERYVALQNVYREKAAEDAEKVHSRVRDLLESIGRPAESISESQVKLFCRESFHLRLVRSGCSIADEHLGRSPHLAAVARHFEIEPDSPCAYYFILRGVDRFAAEYNTLPGALNDDLVEPDVGKLKACVSKVVSEYGLPSLMTYCRDECVHEMSRYGGAELHVIAAIIGANAAQECIKLITRQYVPVNNLFLYDAMNSNSISLQV